MEVLTHSGRHGSSRIDRTTGTQLVEDHLVKVKFTWGISAWKLWTLIG